VLDYVLDHEQALLLARAVIKRAGYGGVTALALRAGLSPQAIGQQLAGRRPLSPKLLAALGLERTRAYRVVGEPVMIEPVTLPRFRKPAPPAPPPPPPNVTIHRLDKK